VTPDLLALTLPSLPGLAAVGGAAGIALAFTKWLLEYVGGRMDKRADRLDENTQAIIDQLRTELDRVETRLEKSDERLDKAFTEISGLRDELAECQKMHAKAEARAAKLEAAQLGWGDMRQRAQEIVSAERLADRKGEE
jgi:chromosome segregation ATPase